jgi:hypothetical protein
LSIGTRTVVNSRCGTAVANSSRCGAGTTITSVTTTDGVTTLSEAARGVGGLRGRASATQEVHDTRTDSVASGSRAGSSELIKEARLEVASARLTALMGISSVYTLVVIVATTFVAGFGTCTDAASTGNRAVAARAGRIIGGSVAHTVLAVLVGKTRAGTGIGTGSGVFARTSAGALTCVTEQRVDCEATASS